MRLLLFFLVQKLSCFRYKTNFKLNNIQLRLNMATKRQLPVDEESLSKKAKGPLVCPDSVNMKRVKLLTPHAELYNGSCVVYWMCRELRPFDNYSLLYAQGLAKAKNVHLKVVFNLVPTYLGATYRQYDFMLKGLQEVETKLRELNIPFYLTSGNPIVNIPTFAREHDACAVVSDFSPLRGIRGWHTGVADDFTKDNASSSSSSSSTTTTNATMKIPYFIVDARNVVPCWYASDKLEYGARTIRSKIQSKFTEFLTEIPMTEPNPDNNALKVCTPVDWDAAYASLQCDRNVKEVTWLTPGYTGAMNMVTRFMEKCLKTYGDERNDPNKDVASHMSPYIHFGQISVQRIVLILKQSNKYNSSADVFIEEAVVRRELAENFCYYNSNYDSLDGAYGWARETLEAHRNDTRPIIYTPAQLEAGETHDDLWNAAQLQMVKIGKMHGFLRMYWAKKILEWTPSPEEALRISIYLNDKYNLDGRDPNGYVGCMWSIVGTHDQGWAERSIFGKIRYMNYQGCKRKFDIKTFVNKYPPAAANAQRIMESADKDMKKIIKDYYSGSKSKT